MLALAPLKMYRCLHQSATLRLWSLPFKISNLSVEEQQKAIILATAFYFDFLLLFLLLLEKEVEGGSRWTSQIFIFEIGFDDREHTHTKSWIKNYISNGLPRPLFSFTRVHSFKKHCNITPTLTRPDPPLHPHTHHSPPPKKSLNLFHFQSRFLKSLMGEKNNTSHRYITLLPPPHTHTQTHTHTHTQNKQKKNTYISIDNVHRNQNSSVMTTRPQTLSEWRGKRVRC